MQETIFPSYDTPRTENSLLNMDTVPQSRNKKRKNIANCCPSAINGQSERLKSAPSMRTRDD